MRLTRNIHIEEPTLMVVSRLDPIGHFFEEQYLLFFFFLFVFFSISVKVCIKECPVIFIIFRVVLQNFITEGQEDPICQEKSSYI